jgi:hypothetical protein
MTINRRQFLDSSGQGIGSLAAAVMLHEATATANEDASTSTKLDTGDLRGVLHHPPKVKRIIQLFMAGAASHIDLWDHKPQLEKHHGEASSFGEHVEAFQDGLGPWMKSPFKFSNYGQCGKAISEAVAPLGDCVDDIAFVHNMVGKTGVHSPRNGCVGELRDGISQRKFANICGVARSSRLCEQRSEKLGCRFLARQSPGHHDFSSAKYAD